MAQYEYKLVPVTHGRRPDRSGEMGLSRDELSTELNLRALTGWEFVGSERIVERKRRWLILVDHREIPCLVFRREVSPRIEAPKEHVRALQTVATEVPVRRVRRAELVQAVRDGRRRIRVKNGVTPEYAAE